MRNAEPFGLSRRTFIVTTSTLLIALRRPSARPPQVLFVCLHGTVKSPIAREILRRRALERNVSVKVRSRGIAPEEGASAELAAALVRDGIDVRHDPLRRLSPTDAAWADVLVYFDPLPFAAANKDLRNWTDIPSVNQHYAQAMAEIRRRIEALIDELERRHVRR